MSGYMSVIGECFTCKAPLTFNASRVPSIRIDGKREPICRACIALANPKRIENGLAPIAIHPQAYEPEEVY